MPNYWLYTYVSPKWAASRIPDLTNKLADAVCAETLREHWEIFAYDYMSFTIAQCAWMGGFKQAAGDVWIAINYATGSDHQAVADYCTSREDYQNRFQCEDPHNKGTMAAVKILRDLLKQFPERHAT